METETVNNKNYPVYLSFKTFQAAIQNLRTHGLPNNIDRTAFDSRSGQEQTQILSGFKFLGLIDDNQKTQPPLRKLVEVKENSQEEKLLLADLLKERYTKVFELDLTTATTGLLQTAIGSYGAKGATRDRAVRFFLKTAEHAGIKLSSRLTDGLRSSGSPDSATPAAATEDGDTATKPNGSRPRRRKKTTNQATVPPVQSDNTGTAMKTIQLPKVGGTLTISGTFNAFGLVGEERTLVYDIIDKMNEFEKKIPGDVKVSQNENASE